MPITLVLVLMIPRLQESARFLESMGRAQEARDTLARFGISLDQDREEAKPKAARPVQEEKDPGRQSLLGFPQRLH